MSKEYKEDPLYDPKTPSERTNKMIKDYYRLFIKNVNGTISPYERARFQNIKNTLKILD